MLLARRKAIFKSPDSGNLVLKNSASKKPVFNKPAIDKATAEINPGSPA
ncbi:hypothetical protein PG990_011846 [Apiospora arundinis]|uniref:Uncharacterized protein n=1 Tax=Apiospora arundinis TaxID=335852 RepID=A0ABR2JJ39_9PEZI